ncbi:cathepsin E, putative [Talaromyces stipitatus ATCC 10500]|uniref:Cathepsin E, putative n=1 Tax=Talaromyces stipitatus (strain ATCC 10500 / CBS 375.48 / QM 6759 / NRRL 1006) TaxID=441959 RepID=B8MQV3_TALSN|nr:cathepsin E, putative [Talaromyces stipitatus ATCC 10500]EED12788.1 cathepsin E, putative [Talaromyces stipitatus ATCC 10500]
MISFITLLAASAALASPIERQAKTAVLPLKRVSNFTSVKNLVSKGQARLNRVNGVAAISAVSEVSSGSVTNEDVSYVAPVSIGGTTYDLIVDTGSSNTWCGAQSSCEPSSTGKSTGGTVEVSYGSGSFSGKEYKDKVSFGGLTVSSQSIGAATSSSGFSGVDGIIGFGPVVLTEGTVSNANTVPTFLDNLYSQGSISEEVLGVSFSPESGSDTDDTNGELTLGGADSSKYSGSLTYFPKLTSGDASYYWGISISSFTFGSTTLASSASGIVDTGTTLIYIPTSAYNKFLSAAGGKTDSSSGLAVFTTKPTSNFGITFGSTRYSLTPSQYLIPTAQYSYYGLSSGKYYAWISDGGSSGVDTIIGQKFLENYYSVFDTTNSRIGFATGI